MSHHPFHPRQQRARSRRGSVLMVVFILVIVMTLAAYGYMLSMQTEHIATATLGERMALQQASLSAREMFAALLETARDVRTEWGGLENNPDLFGGIPLVARDESPSQATRHSWEEPETQFYVLSMRADEHAAPTVQFGGINESAKLHLGRLVEWDQLWPGSGRQALMRLPGMEAATADAILDWIDPDHEPREFGAEADSYTDAPTTPRNGLPWELEELLYVRGVTRELLWGEISTDTPPSGAPGEQRADRRAAGTMDDPTNQSPTARSRTTSRPDTTFPRTTPPGVEAQARPWSDFLTVYSAERNESRAGQPRVDVNATDLASVHAQLAQSLPLACANFVILYRQYGPGIAQAPSATAEAITIDFGRPADYPIKNLFDLVGATVTITEGDTTTTVTSPFTDTVGENPFDQLVDVATDTDAARLVGRININLAPPEVLQALPGLSQEAWERIVSARSMSADDVQKREHVTWPWSEGHVDRETMRSLLPYITTGGDAYRLNCWGVAGSQMAPWGCEIVLDASEGKGRQLYYRELPASHFTLPAAP